MRPTTTGSATMTMVKKEFLRKWALGLQMCSSTNVNKESSVLERKKAIKLSADVAMASTRSPSTLWSTSLISNVVVSDPDNSTVVEHILGRKLTNAKNFSSDGSQLRSRWRMVKRKRKTMMMMKKKKKKKTNATGVAGRMVKKRTEVLRRLVPGGEGMEECRLIREALDYMLSLRVQVDVMHHLATATTHMFDDIPK